MATGSINIPIKCKTVTGTTSSTGTLTYDTTGITKVIAARARPSNQQTWSVLTAFIRADNYIQVVDSVYTLSNLSFLTNASVTAEIYYI